jgi:hypothetical protein
VSGPLPQFAYAQARLAARLGGRASEADWARLAAIADAGSFIEATKRTPLGRFMSDTAADHSIHTVEVALRRQWRREVENVAGWYPASFQPAFAWLTLLPLLPAMAHLLAGGAVLPWMSDEADLAPFLDAARGTLDARLADAGLAAFRPAAAGETTVGNCWLQHWMSLCLSPTGEHREIEAILSSIEVDQNAVSRMLFRAFRRHQRDIASAFSYLGLFGLDLQRLRGEIALRKVLPSIAPGRWTA